MRTGAGLGLRLVDDEIREPVLVHVPQGDRLLPSEVVPVEGDPGQPRRRAAQVVDLAHLGPARVPGGRRQERKRQDPGKVPTLAARNPIRSLARHRSAFPASLL
jgi:hypothetical protein